MFNIVDKKERTSSDKKGRTSSDKKKKTKDPEDIKNY
jgi:hypothetical protein